jgi:type IV pilus assembly protein PilA
MIKKLRARAQSEQGFTLVELLVVMLIIGLLAAIAIPAFFNQRDKANDASAKEAVRTMQTAMETLATDNNGSYANGNGAAGLTALNKIESTIPGTACVGTANGCPQNPTAAATSYTVTWVAKTTGNTYSIARATNGTLTYTCHVANTAKVGGCSNTNASGDGTWN